jgi:hypothetical protein
MLRKIILGVAAAAAVSAAAFSPTAAEAKVVKFKKTWHPHHHFHGAYAFGGGYGGCYVKRWVPTPYGPRFRCVNRCW